MQKILALLSAFILTACSITTVTPILITPTTNPTSTAVFNVTPTGNHYYVDENLGSDENPGSEAQPWQTIEKAVNTVAAGDTIYVRGGIYSTILGGWSFQNSGTQSQPITLTNYPGEQVIFKDNQVMNNNYPAFRCEVDSNDPTSWQTSNVQYIRILGTDVMPKTLSDGVVSQKGIVIQGEQAEQSAGIDINGGCSHWEVAKVDFVEVSYGIFSDRGSSDPDYWYVHDNRVYNYYRESGMQFNGNDNMITNNEIYKVSSELDTPYGCQMLNLLGHGNEVSGNKISRLGSTAPCIGILFEWGLSDKNIIEQNKIYDVPKGIEFEGGSNNIIRNNTITATAGTETAAIAINSYDNQTSWPCNDTINPASEDLPYLSNPRNCHSRNNQIYNNTIIGFPQVISMYPVADTTNIIYNNTIH